MQFCQTEGHLNDDIIGGGGWRRNMIKGGLGRWSKIAKKWLCNMWMVPKNGFSYCQRNDVCDRGCFCHWWCGDNVDWYFGNGLFSEENIWSLFSIEKANFTLKTEIMIYCPFSCSILNIRNFYILYKILSHFIWLSYK